MSEAKTQRWSEVTERLTVVLRKREGFSLSPLHLSRAARTAPLDSIEVGPLENNRRAKFYTISRAGEQQSVAETENWRGLRPSWDGEEGGRP